TDSGSADLAAAPDADAGLQHADRIDHQEGRAQRAVRTVEVELDRPGAARVQRGQPCRGGAPPAVVERTGQHHDAPLEELLTQPAAETHDPKPTTPSGTLDPGCFPVARCCSRRGWGPSGAGLRGA